MNDESNDPNPPGHIDGSGIGIVYVLSRAANASIVKIGHTSKKAESRASNYTDGEWVVHSEYSMPLWLAKQTERRAHAILAQYWLDPRMTGGSASEIFTCPTEEGDIAVQLAFLEELEHTLKLLRLPSTLIDIISKEHRISDNISANKIQTSLLEANSRQQITIAEMAGQIEALKQTIRNLAENSENTIVALKIKNEALETRILDLERELLDSQQSRKRPAEEFAQEVQVLENISNRKINQKDFELLRDGFRRAMEVIHELKTNRDQHMR
jgi:hypothetical protein